MIYSITASADATLYEKTQDGIYSSSTNTGIDEVVEISKVLNGSLGPGPFNSRFLIKFQIPASIHSGSDGQQTFSNADGTLFSPPKTFLKLYSANKDSQLNITDKIELKAVSQSWEMGTGRRTNNPTEKAGCSWKNPIGLDLTNVTDWKDHNGTFQYGASTHSAFNIDASYVYDTGSTSRRDIKFDVSPWAALMTASGGNYGVDKINNNGWLLKRDSTYESDNIQRGSLRWFSTDTHTIYQPRLEFCWDDSKWSHGSLVELDTTDASSIFIYLKNNRGDYKYGVKAKFRIVGRKKYPTKTYSTTSEELLVKYLPSGSAFYSVKDLKTGESMIPYDSEFTRISCDSVGNYFEMLTSNLSPERYYQIEIKLLASGSTTDIIGYYPIKDIFKVVR